MLKKKIFKLNNIIYPVIFPIINFIAFIFSKITEKLYGFLMLIEWGRSPSPEWMDHDQDYFYQSRNRGKTFFFERGVLPKIFASELINDKKNINNLNILDLCCGDGFFSQFFLHDIAKNITMIDLDIDAIKRAKQRSKRLKFLNKININYIVEDILKYKLDILIKKNNIYEKYDLIVFNAAIEHFKEEQVYEIFDSCKKIMNKNAIVFGYTLVENENHVFDHHELLFKTKEDLQNLVSKNFKTVECFQSLSETRHNLYFFAKNN